MREMVERLGAQAAQIEYRELHMGSLIAEGSQGGVYRAIWHSAPV